MLSELQVLSILTITEDPYIFYILACAEEVEKNPLLSTNNDVLYSNGKDL